MLVLSPAQAVARPPATGAGSPAVGGGSPAAAIWPGTTFAPRSMTIRITHATVGRPIAPGFLGLSMEFGSLYGYVGGDPRAPNPVFARLIENLTAGRPPLLRIGGDSTDRTWWPVDGMATPQWATYTLTPNWAAVARALAEVTRARLILGINLLADSTSIATREAEAFLDGIGRARIAALEIGNEPERYSTQPWYWKPDGSPVTGRPAGYDYAEYAREVERIRSALPRTALAGPAAGTASWFGHVPALLRDEPGLAQVTVHRYPLNRCVSNRASPKYPTVPNLLSIGASRGLVRGMGRWVDFAHRHRIGFRVDELNAVTCGGKAGVSDTFAAALWTLDTQFWMARTGVDGVEVHIHAEAPANQLFAFRRKGKGWVGSVRPQYYGLLMFARAAPAGARLLRIVGAAPGQLETWATVAPDGLIRVVLINLGLRRSTTVAVRPPSPGPPATLERLRAASAHARAGVTLGGQSLGSRSTTGTLQGSPKTGTVWLVHGAYRVQMPPASAAMLTLRPS